MIKVEPGSFGLFLTHEYLYLPDDIYGLISLRFRYKIRGLTNVSGFHIDPGYYGHILFGVYNTGPSEIIIKHLDSVFMITFVKVDRKPKMLYEGPSIDDISPENVERLRGPPVSLKNLDDRVKKLETYFRIIVYILVAIIIGIILELIRSMSNGGG